MSTAQTNDSTEKIIDRPQKFSQAKDENSALSQKLRAKGGPVGDDRQVKGVFRRICAEYGMFKDQKNVIERRFTSILQLSANPNTLQREQYIIVICVASS